MKCQMLCGRCKSTATLALNAGGKIVLGLNFSTTRIEKRREPKRTIYACGDHAENLERCAQLYGGTVRRLQ